VSVGEVDDYFQNNPALMTSGDTLSDNDISYVGQDYSDTVGIWAGYTRHLTITHNDIGHTPYSGMSIGWGWGYASPCSMQAAQGLGNCAHGTNYAGGNQVTDNYVHDVMNTLYDGGPIYTNGGQGEDGAGVDSVLAGNYVSIGNHDDNMLYQDEGSSYWDTYGNVVNFASGGTWIGMWTPTINNITVGPDNYSSTTNTNNNGTNIAYTAPTVVSNGAWPAAAQVIMTTAGPRGQAAPPVYEDDSQALSYTGSWSAEGTLADQGDTHTTSSPGAAVSLTFTSQSVAFVAGPGGGTAAITIDGKSAGQVATDAFQSPGRTVFTDTSLSPGQHTITVTDVSGQLTAGSFQVPALPYLTVPRSDFVPGRPITVTSTLANPSAAPLHGILMSLVVPAGWTATNAVQLATVPAGGTGAATFTVTPPSSQPPGSVPVTAVAHYSLPAGGRQVLVESTQAQTPFSSLPAAFDNVGVSADSDTAAADLDGSGYSFSATALANAGVTPGSTVTAGGLNFTWPSPAAGSADNVVAGGQQIEVNQSGSAIGFLETSTYGSSQGQGTIIYANGTTQTFILTSPDWYSGPSAGTVAPITMAYRNTPGNGQDNHPVYVYEQTVPLESTSPVASIVLPDVSQGVTAGSSALHVFAISVG
jgi:hypothetical protein